MRTAQPAASPPYIFPPPPNPRSKPPPNPRSDHIADADLDSMELRESSSRLPPPNPAMPYREDCWSEGATSALIDAWGDRYLELNRGNLRQKDWQEVADTVNSRRGGVRRPSRTDSQCKNRIDTLKKKYKAEKSRISDSGGAIASQWPFYPRLDVLIGNSPSVTSKKPPSPSPPLALPLPSHRKPATAALPAARPVESKRAVLAVSDSFQRNYSAAAAAAAAAAAEGDSMSSSSSSRERSRSSPERSPPALVAAPAPVLRHVKRLRADCEDERGGEDGVRQLARAIERFAEIYEKVEEGKHQQMMELERKRFEFTKGLEFQRMQIFVDSQVQLEKIKRARGADAGEQGSSAALSLLLQPCFFNV